MGCFIPFLMVFLSLSNIYSSDKIDGIEYYPQDKNNKESLLTVYEKTPPRRVFGFYSDTFTRKKINYFEGAIEVVSNNDFEFYSNNDPQPLLLCKVPNKGGLLFCYPEVIKVSQDVDPFLAIKPNDCDTIERNKNSAIKINDKIYYLAYTEQSECGQVGHFDVTSVNLDSVFFDIFGKKRKSLPNNISHVEDNSSTTNNKKNIFTIWAGVFLVTGFFWWLLQNYR